MSGRFRVSGLVVAGVLLGTLPIASLALTAEEIYSRSAPGVVLIRSMSSDGSSQGEQGSGFVISHDGYVLTAKHVVPASIPEPTVVATLNGRPVMLRIIARHSKLDAALLRIVGAQADLRPVPIRRTPARAGEPLYVLGYPVGLTKTYMVSGIVSTPPDADLATDSAINEGNSGGPVIDVSGCVIGIVWGGIKKVDGQPIVGVKFAVPVPGFQNMLPSSVWETTAAVAASDAGATLHITDSVSRIQTEHDDLVRPTTKAYTDYIYARPGYVFDAVEKVEHVSLAPTGLSFPAPQISADRKSIALVYSLQSGPIVDQTRSWIDMNIYTSQRPITPAARARSGPTCP